MIPYWVEPSTHAYLVTSILAEAARLAFPIPDIIKRNRVMSDDTFVLIGLRGSNRQQSSQYGRQLKLHIKATWFIKWRCHTKAYSMFVEMLMHPQFPPHAFLFKLRATDRAAWCRHMSDAWSHLPAHVVEAMHKAAEHVRPSLNLHPLIDNISNTNAAELRRNRATLYKEYHTLSDRIDTALDADYAAYLGQVDLNGQSFLSETTSRSYFAHVRKGLPVSSTPPAALKGPTGAPATDYTAARKIVRDRFGGLLAGRECKLSQIAANMRETYVSRPLMHARAPWAPADIPSYQQVALRFSKCKQYKTAAEDGMAPDLAHSNPLLYAKAFHPLYLKAILLTLPPIQFTGGQGCELYKGCGDPSEIINFRDVHISTSPGTVFAGIMRVPLASRLQGGAIDTQYGAGLNAGGADFTHLAARATLDLADARNMSCALLFVDIKTAFAALQRFLVLPIPEALPSFRALLVQSGFSGPFIDEWMVELETLLPWSRLPGKDALLDLIAALHQFSWMSTEGLDGVMHLAQGSLAGNPLGDIIFSAGMTVLVKRLRASIVKLGHLSQLDDPTLRAVVEPVDAILQQPQQPFPYVADVSYVDDLILPLILPAEQIEKALPLVLAAAHETYYMCGFEINWKPKKTSIILVFKGPLSRKVSRHFAVNYPGAVPFTDYTGTQREAPIVQQYKHMGGQLRANGVVLPELKARYSSLQSMIKPLERRIFANPFIPVDKKLYTAQTILYTRLLYNAGTWPSLNLVSLGISILG
jgi:hypothetical protein